MQVANKYETGRILSGLSQEAAAEKLYISTRTLSRIERGTQQCSRDIAEAMATVYKAPWVADPTVPLNYKPLSKAEAALKFLKERNDVNKVMDRALEIFADGLIDETESEDYQMITKEIGDERIASRDLLYAR